MTTLAYMKFVPIGEEDHATVYRIFLSEQEKHIGEIRWHAKAKRYVFFPEPHVWLDARGLSMLSEYCERKTSLAKVTV